MMVPEPQHQLATIDLVDSSDDEAPEHNGDKASRRIYTIELAGPPKPMPGPTFMAWIRNGSLIRRVVNKAKPEISRLRRIAAQCLAECHGIPTEAHPVFSCCPVTVIILFFRRLPNSSFVNNNRKRPLRRAFRGAYLPDTQKPDIDNLTKLILDCLEGVLYKDDDQVVKCEAYKFLDNKHPYEGRTIVQVSPFHKEHIPVLAPSGDT